MKGVASFLHKWWEWFQNHSLRFKMVLMLFSIVTVIQIVNGFIFVSMFSDKFEENICEANLATTRQISYNLNRAMIDIVSEMVPIREKIRSNSFAPDDNDEINDYINHYLLYQPLFNQLIASDDNYQFIHSMIILEGETQHQYLYTADGYLNLNNENLFEKILSENRLYAQCHWSGIMKADYYFAGREENLITITMPVYYYKNVENLLLVNLDIEALRKYLTQIGRADGSLLIQVNDSDWIFDGENNEDSYSETDFEEIIRLGGGREIRETGNNVIMTSQLSINNWNLSMIMPKRTIADNAGVLSKAIMLVMITTAVILFFSISNIVFIVTKPIKKMTEIMEANRHTRMIKYRFNARYNDEVGVLAETYNKLMDEIQQLMIDIEKEQIQSRRTYQRMLQMQIKPHFLYNTLEAAKFLVEMGDPNGVEMLTAIGKFYKVSLSGVENTVTIKEETEHLGYYLQILKLRYSSKYDYTIQIAPDILGNEIVRFSLQPLVENAVYHGIKQKRQKGFVKVLGYIQNYQIHIVIWDNGAGIRAEDLKKIRARIYGSEILPLSEHIGIVNVHQRIRMRYGKPYGLDIESEEGEYTRVEIILPIKRSEEHV